MIADNGMKIFLAVENIKENRQGFALLAIQPFIIHQYLLEGWLGYFRVIT